jgi:AraC-like DNA-binding protein
VAKNITYIHSYSLSNLLFIFTHIVILVFLNLIFFKGWSQPALFSKIFEKEKKIKYKGSPLTDELKEFYLKEIEQYMDAEKPYLDFSISLGQLSEKTKISTNYLSQVINELLKKNFFDFINEYRINDAKMMLASPKYQNDSIQEILYRVGFNSKSTFYTIFKKNTGMTPTAFRKKSRLKQN